MKCPICGAENPEGQKFCGSCGSAIPVPPPEPQVVESAVAPPKQSWMRSHRTVLVVLVVVAIVVLASIGLIYTRPLSKIKILARNASGQHAYYSFLIDGVEKARGTIYPGDFVTIGAWSVKTGTHSVKADCHYLGQLGPSLDGVYDYNFEYRVGPLSTKNVWIQLTPEIPNLVGDLTMYYDDYWDEVSVEGKVFNYANVACFGTLTYTIQDLRGWIMSDTVVLGRFGVDVAFLEVSKTYDWPNYYDGQYNYGLVPSWTYTLTFF